MDSLELDVYRICIDGVVVRYCEESYHIMLTIEGTLPANTVNILVQDLLQKLFVIEGAIFQVKDLGITVNEQ